MDSQNSIPIPESECDPKESQILEALRSTMNQLTDSSNEFEELYERAKRDVMAVPETKSVYFSSGLYTSLIEKIFLRYHNDMDRIGLSPYSPSHKVNPADNPFANLIVQLANLCETSEEDHELIRAVLMALKPNIFLKVVKTALLIGDGAACAALKIFSPTSHSDQLEKANAWDKCISNTIPSKSLTSSSLFWGNWFRCVLDSSRMSESWKIVSDHWVDTASRQNPETLIPATYALLTIFREAKNRACCREWGLLEVNLQQLITVCMSSLNLEVRDCALITAYCLADLHYSIAFPESPNGSDKFDLSAIGSDRLLFKQMKQFYTGEEFSLEKLAITENASIGSTSQGIAQKQDLVHSDTNILKEPVSFENIYEALVEGGNENKMDDSKIQSHLFRITIQLISGMGMDAEMAEKLTRVIMDLSGRELLSTPSIFALTEISKVHIEQFCSVMSALVFGKQQYAMGQRFEFMKTYGTIMELRAGVKCLTCFESYDEALSNALADLGGDPDLVENYKMGRKNLHKPCYQCIKKHGNSLEDTVAEVEVESTVDESADWKEIRERRIASKTRRLASKRVQVGFRIEETFSTTVAPQIFSSISRPLFDRHKWELWDTSIPNCETLDDQFLVSCLQFLRYVITSTVQKSSVFYTTYAPAVVTLLSLYGSHTCTEARLAVTRLCCLLIYRSTDLQRMIETLGRDTFKLLESLRYSESEAQIKSLMDTLLCTAEYRVLGRVEAAWVR